MYPNTILQKRSRYEEGDRVKVPDRGSGEYATIFSVDRTTINPSSYPYGVTFDDGTKWFFSDTYIEGRLEQVRVIKESDNSGRIR